MIDSTWTSGIARIGESSVANDNTRMPFGKHQGKKLQDVPAEYLDWLIGEPDLPTTHPAIFQYISDNEELIEADLRKQGKL